MSVSTQPSLHDSIVAYLRERPEGVSASVLGEHFLKLKGAATLSVAAAMRAMLLPDKRCFQDETGLWHARARKITTGTPLAALPFVAVYGLMDPVSLKLWHLSLWEIVPALSCIASGWIIDPATLSFDDREHLVSPADAPFTASVARELLRYVAMEQEDRIPIFLGSTSRRRVAVACASVGEPFPEDTMVISELLRACELPVARPLTLAALCAAVSGNSPVEERALQQGERFARAAAELLALLGRKGIETRDDLDALFCKDKEPLFAGKEFTYKELLALPATPGVYGFKDSADNYLYIGKAANLRRRLLNYFGDTDESPEKLARIREQSGKLVTYQCGSELECLIHEYRLIRKYSPPLNRQTEVVESKGTFRPIDDCIVLLPNVAPGKGMSVWVRKEQKILLKSFDALPDTHPSMTAELDSFFFSKKLNPENTDFPEHQIATRWIRRHAENLAIVPVHRLANAEEVYEALRISWREFCEERGLPAASP